MPIQFACPHCGHRSVVQDQYAGQRGPCSACGQTISIPFPTPAKSSNSWLIILLIGIPVALLVCGGILLALLLPAVQSAREAARRATCANNVKMIMLAMANYESVNQTFPPAYTVDANGQPLHSWRTLILPYLGHGDLFQKIKLNEPWNSPHNQQFASEIVTIYQCPSQLDLGAPVSHYVLVTGKGTAFGNPGKGLSSRAILDGASNTLFVVETNSPVSHWMEPTDMDIETFAGLANQRQSRHSNTFVGGTADGAIRFLTDATPAAERRGLATYNGGEPIAP